MKKTLIDLTKLNEDLRSHGWGLAEREAIIKTLEKAKKLETIYKS